MKGQRYEVMQMKIYDLQLGALGANCYVIETGDSRCIAVDIGGDSERFLSFLKSKNLTLTKILLTHGHFDHTGGAEAVRKATGAEVFVHVDDAKMLQSAVDSLYTLIQLGEFAPVSEFIAVEEGCCITDGDCRITVIGTPGHSEGRVCYVCGNAMFTGDTLFCGSIGRTDFPGSNLLDMKNSLQKLYQMDKDFRIYPGHGESSTLENEKRTNPYMRGFR